MNRLLYNNKNDAMYLIIYKLGNGISSNVWYSIELKNYKKSLKNCKNNFVIDCKALKILNDDSEKEFKKEIQMNELLTYHGIKSDYLNYNLGGFIHENKKIIINEVMDSSLEKLCETLKFNFDEKYKKNIIEQIENSINYVHLCNYIHADLKLDNFLVCGLNEKQTNILNYAKKYNFNSIFNNNKKKTLNIENNLNTLIDEIIEEFNIEYSDLISNSDNYSCENSNDDDNEDDNEDENEDDNNSYESYSTNASTFNSDLNEFDKIYDKFHIKKIDIFLNDMEEQKENEIIEIIENNYLSEFYLNKLKTIKIKLNDFGLIKKPGSLDTINTRCYRSPKNIMGFCCDHTDDLWALEMIKYEMYNGKVLIDITKDKNYNVYNNNLLCIKHILNKKKININEFEKSKRFNSIFSSDKSFLFK